MIMKEEHKTQLYEVKMITQRILVLFMISFYLIMKSVVPVEAQVSFTKEEQDYIKNQDVIMAASLPGSAPLQYAGSDGEVKGISKELLEEVSSRTGLIFEYNLYDTLDQMYSAGADLIFGIPYQYVDNGMALSSPYLTSETILYINASVDPNDLDELIYGAVKGSALPEGIKEENAIYFDTREETMDAVNSGQVDYGYGNEYSIAFYNLQNSYSNIISVPGEKESREYMIGFLKDDEVLLSIVNKAIDSIDDSYMKTLILNQTTQIDRKVTVSKVLNTYGAQIFSVAFLMIVILTWSVIRNVKAKNEIEVQYDRYQVLSQTSNEYLYEYNVKTSHLELSENCIQLFGKINKLDDLKDAIQQLANQTEQKTLKIKLPIASGEKRVFKSINSALKDDKGRTYSMIGKLIDITEEEAEKRELIIGSTIDGLTNLYNAETTKRLITESIQNAEPHQINALIIIDCDNFKGVNDIFGHLEGDKVLMNIGKGIIETFHVNDITGRVGGDEFCIYMEDVASTDFIVEKCQQFKSRMKNLNHILHTPVSIGISLLTNEKTYADVFEKADLALYAAKKNGGDQIQFYQSGMQRSFE